MRNKKIGDCIFMDIITTDAIVSKAKDLKIEGKCAVCLILGFGLLGLASKAIDKGYGMSFNCSEKEGLGLTLTPPTDLKK